MGKHKDPNKLTSDEKAAIRESKKPYRIDKLLVPAIIVCVLAIAYSLVSSIFFGHSVVAIDVADQLALRDVFFGEGKYQGSYVVLCVPPFDSSASSGSRPPLNSAFVEASKILAATSTQAKFATLDCGAPSDPSRASGTSIAQRFKLETSRRPAAVFVAGLKFAGAPVQLASAAFNPSPKSGALTSGEQLAKTIKTLLEPRSVKIESTRQLTTYCLERDYCLLLLKGKEVTPQVRDIFKELTEEFPAVQFAHMDASVVALNLESSKGLEYVEGQHRLVLFRRVPDADGADKPKQRKARPADGDGEERGGKEDDAAALDDALAIATSARSYKSSDYSKAALTTFIEDSLKDSESAFKALKTLPKASIRTKKSAENAKKKKEAADKKKADYGGRVRDDPDDDNSGGGGATKDERKAERERQRERARKEREANMTPEEIAEADRKREAEKRRRVEEQMKNTYVEQEGGEEEATVDYGDEDGGGGDEEEEIIDLD